MSLFKNHMPAAWAAIVFGWLLATVPCAPAGSSANAEAEAEAEETKPVETLDDAVVAGREAFDTWQGFPWYDPATDDVRRVDVRVPYDWSWLDDWFPDGLHLDSIVKILGWTLLVLALAVLIYLLLRYFWERFHEGAAPAPAAEKVRPSPAIQFLPIALQGARGDLLAQAKRLYEQGDFAQAVLYLFSYQLVQLDEHQCIRMARGKTNRQYLRELPRVPFVRRLVERTMVAFEDVFFGHHSIDRARFETCWVEIPEFQAFLREKRE